MRFPNDQRRALQAGLARGLFSMRELRFASRGALAVAVVGALAVGAWMSPWSPAAMDRAERLAARGDVDGAVAAWLDIADHASGGRAQDALWQAAWLASVDVQDPQRSVELLRRFASEYPDSDRAPQALARLGTLYQLYLQDPVRAAEAWAQAGSTHPDHPDAGRWQLDAGLAFHAAGLPERAVEPLEAATEHDDTRVAAHLALGRLALAGDPAVAYDHYSEALQDADNDADRSLARLGAASALESLDDVDQALAELESADATDTAAQRRRARLEAREQR
ncbi:MAG: tetratricopeptide repeat protein [Alphaproteobacteria bacterium]|nr:tetratricopeptide repeat protein [Alphaproteobacteria bacterium]